MPIDVVDFVGRYPQFRQGWAMIILVARIKEPWATDILVKAYEKRRKSDATTPLSGAELRQWLVDVAKAWPTLGGSVQAKQLAERGVCCYVGSLATVLEEFEHGE